MSLATIAATLEGFAETVVTDAVNEGKTFVAQEVGAAEQFAETTVTNGYTDFQDLVNKVGKDATQLVTNLMNDSSLSGLEKSNLAATQLVQQAATNGITVFAGVANYPFNANGAAIGTPTWVACSGTNNVTVQF